MTEPQHDLQDAKLQDLRRESLKAHIPDLLAKDSKHYLVEYGSRVDDGAMVFHFFSGKDDPGWDASYRMDKRLEHAIRACFNTATVSADYSDDVQSFCVIVHGLGAALDPWPLVERFFSEIERGVDAS